MTRVQIMLAAAFGILTIPTGCQPLPPKPIDFVECFTCYNNGSRARAERQYEKSRQDYSIFTTSYH